MKPDWWGRKDYVILQAVRVFGTVEDRKMLGKIIYFANLKTRMFEYQWCTYGVCSAELGYKIADHIHYSFDFKGDIGKETERDLRLSERGGRLLGDERHQDVDSALESAHALLDGLSGRQMDLLASVHHIALCGQEPGDVHGFMQRITPEVVFTAADVAWAMQFLESRGLIEPALPAEPAPMPA